MITELEDLRKLCTKLNVQKPETTHLHHRDERHQVPLTGSKVKVGLKKQRTDETNI